MEQMPNLALLRLLKMDTILLLMQCANGVTVH